MYIVHLLLAPPLSAGQCEIHGAPCDGHRLMGNALRSVHTIPDMCDDFCEGDDLWLVFVKANWEFITYIIGFYMVLSHIMLGLYAVCSLRDTHSLFWMETHDRLKPCCLVRVCSSEVSGWLFWRILNNAQGMFEMIVPYLARYIPSSKLR